MSHASELLLAHDPVCTMEHDLALTLSALLCCMILDAARQS